MKHGSSSLGIGRAEDALGFRKTDTETWEWLGGGWDPAEEDRQEVRGHHRAPGGTMAPWSLEKVLSLFMMTER